MHHYCPPPYTTCSPSSKCTILSISSFAQPFNSFNLTHPQAPLQIKYSSSYVKLHSPVQHAIPLSRSFLFFATSCKSSPLLHDPKCNFAQSVYAPPGTQWINLSLADFIRTSWPVLFSFVYNLKPRHRSEHPIQSTKAIIRSQAFRQTRPTAKERPIKCTRHRPYNA